MRTSLKEMQNLDGVNMLLDKVIAKESLKNDAALCRFLGVPPPVVSKLRHGRIGLTGDIKIAIFEKTDIPIPVIQSLVNAVNPQ